MVHLLGSTILPIFGAMNSRKTVRSNGDQERSDYCRLTEILKSPVPFKGNR